MDRVFSQSKCLVKCIPSLNILGRIKVLGYENKDTGNEIGDSNSNDDQPKNVVHVQNVVLLNDSFIVALISLQLLEQSFESADVDQFN